MTAKCSSLVLCSCLCPASHTARYLDLFAGKNDYEAVKHAGPGGHKEINRTNLSSGQIEAMLKRAVVAPAAPASANAQPV